MIYLFGFFSMFLVIIPVIVPLMMDLGITMKDFLILNAYFGIVVAILEVPSGYLSDMWGRKNVLLLATVFNLICYIVLYFSESLPHLYVYQTISAVSLSLISGADLSLLYDNETPNGTKNLRSHKTKIMENYNFSRLSGETLAAVLGGILAVYSFKMVIAGQVLASIFFFFIAVNLKESKYEKMSKTDHLGNLKMTVSHLLKDRGTVLIFLNSAFWSLATFSAIWLFQKQWKEDGIEMQFFGYIWASYTLTSAIASKFVTYFRKKLGVYVCLLIISVFPLIGYFGISQNSYYMAAFFGYFFAVSRAFKFVF